MEAAVSAPPATTGRVRGLDALRGLAALYVVLFHCWLYSFGGFPANHGPRWTGWLLYGHLAVVYFLVISGYSLAIAPARHDWRIGGVLRYARRRAWRILPPYWAALLICLVIAWTVIPQPHSGPPTARSVVVYGLLLQDVVTAPIPNGAFWSIAVEVELYVLLPVLLLIRRRLGALVVLAAVTVPVTVLGVLRPDVSPVDKRTGLTFQLAPLFVMGLVAAGLAAYRRRPWHWWALLCAAPVVLVMLHNGSVWTVGHYYWIDLAIGPAMALSLAAVASGQPAALVRVLTSGPLRQLGMFSYSLYLIHLPIVLVISRQVVGPRVPSGVPAFLVTVALAVPASVLAARLFAAGFEIPFLRYRSWPDLAAAVRARRWRPASGYRSPPNDGSRYGGAVVYQSPLPYLLAMEGIALLRGFGGEHDREFSEARIAEIRRLLDTAAFSGRGITAERVDTGEGYGIWSHTYDRPGNGLYPYEEPIVHDIVGSLAPGVALDAACGTGRWTEYLAARGHRVIGVDSSPDMLDRARTRVPRAEFHEGDLHQLPLPDDHVDLVVCALALTHLPDLKPVMSEFARVLRPGGHLVISDVHHEIIALAGPPRVRTPDGRPALLPAYRHRAGDYLAAALPLGFQVRRCDEPRRREPIAPAGSPDLGRWDDWPWSLLGQVPEAADSAWNSTPTLVVWHFELAC